MTSKYVCMCVCVCLPVPECLQHIVGSRVLVKPCMFASLFELSPELPALLLFWALGHIINMPEVIQGQRPCQEQTHAHNPLVDYFYSFI